VLYALTPVLLLHCPVVSSHDLRPPGVGGALQGAHRVYAACVGGCIQKHTDLRAQAQEPQGAACHWGRDAEDHCCLDLLGQLQASQLPYLAVWDAHNME
jgi:hypothetical protein